MLPLPIRFFSLVYNSQVSSYPTAHGCGNIFIWKHIHKSLVKMLNISWSWILTWSHYVIVTFIFSVLVSLISLTATDLEHSKPTYNNLNCSALVQCSSFPFAFANHSHHLCCLCCDILTVLSLYLIQVTLRFPVGFKIKLERA